MRFVDEAYIRVMGGRGGDGVIHFHREKYKPKGGPDGGDGGCGGAVVLVGDESLPTLVDFKYQRSFQAESGEPGGGDQRTGRSGDECLVPVPLGTRVYNQETREFLGEVLAQGQRLVVARGGAGGRGNVHFKSSTNRTPRTCTGGERGESFALRLELRVLAHVGLVGLPNAGKSSLIRALSSAHPKVADYPFTTLQPVLGVVRVDPERSFVMAEIPGLIEDAAKGAGLGTRFLRQLARNRILLHVVEVSPMDGSDPAENVQIVERELGRFDPTLLDRQRWLVINKLDLLPEQEQAAYIHALSRKLHWARPIYGISAETGMGLRVLIEGIMNTLEEEGGVHSLACLDN